MSATYPGSGDPNTHRTDYTPQWLGRLADDVTVEASVMNGIARVQRIVISHRPLRSVLLWSGVMAAHFAGTEYAQYFVQPQDLEAASAEVSR
jgi:hypothetical protein